MKLDLKTITIIALVIIIFCIYIFRPTIKQDTTKIKQLEKNNVELLNQIKSRDKTLKDLEQNIFKLNSDIKDLKGKLIIKDSKINSLNKDKLELQNKFDKLDDQKVLEYLKYYIR